MRHAVLHSRRSQGCTGNIGAVEITWDSPRQMYRWTFRLPDGCAVDGWAPTPDVCERDVRRLVRDTPDLMDLSPLARAVVSIEGARRGCRSQRSATSGARRSPPP